MQRWILPGLLGFLAMVLLLGGAFWGYRTMQGNRMTKILFQTPLPNSSVEERTKLSAEFKSRFGNPEAIALISRESGFAKVIGATSEEAAATELGNRFFCEADYVTTKDGGKTPSVNIGFTCRVKEFPHMKPVIEKLGEQIRAVVPPGTGN